MRPLLAVLALLVGWSPSAAATPTPTPGPVMAVVPTCGPASAVDAIEVIARNLGVFGVYVVFNPGEAEQRFPAQPGENGSLDQTFRVGPVPAGTYVVQVQDLDDVPMASTQFVEPCPPPPTATPGPAPSPSVPGRFSFPPRLLNPTLTLIPAVGPPGTVLTARGADFPPSTQVQVSWSQGIAGGTGAPVTTDASGSFATTVLVFPHDELGARVLTAVSLPTPNRALLGFASASFLVVPGSVQPRDFSSRR